MFGIRFISLVGLVALGVLASAGTAEGYAGSWTRDLAPPHSSWDPPWPHCPTDAS